MSIKKYVNGSFVDYVYRKYGTETDTLTSLPADVIADGQSASAVIKGNLSQSGTPTPTTPITPSECGNKTANLWNNLGFSANTISTPGIHTATNSYGTTLSTTTGGSVEIVQSGSGGDIKYQNGFFMIELDFSEFATGDIFTISFDYEITNLQSTIDSTIAYIGRGTTSTQVTGNWRTSGRAVISATFNAATMVFPYVEIRLCGNSINISNVQVNRGSTVKPYEPWGYKIPILCGNTTTPVYLGEVQSTRNVYKIILTGQENWAENQSGTNTLRARIALTYNNMAFADGFCSHVQFKASNLSNDEELAGCYDNRLYLRLSKTIAPTLTDFTTYLQQQFAAGTPVCLWYVLATPQTTTLNEPIRKIGSYSDSVSVTGIPTTGTAEQFDVTTTLKPSEVDLTYHGWHSHSDTKFTT